MSPSLELLLGIDVGTSGCKAAVYDATGVEHGAGYVGYQLSRLRPGFVEQDPSTWWDAVIRAVHLATSRTGGSPVRAVAVSSTNALVAVRPNGRPVREAIMQLDERASFEATELACELGARDVLRRCGNTLSAGPHWLPTLRWLQRHEPHVIAAASTFLYPGGWITFRLTGERCVDFSRASTTLLLDAASQRWRTDLAQAVGVHSEQLPRLGSSADVAGRLRPAAADELGLPPGIPIATGAMDSVAAALGAGATSVGDGVAVLGTTARVMAVADRFVPDERLVTVAYPIPGSWLIMGVVWGAGTALRSAATQWSGEADFERLENEARSVLPSAGQLGFDAESGIFANCAAHHGPADVARAVMEGVVTSLAARADILRGRLGLPLTHFSLVGGGARSALLTELFADLLDVTAVLPTVTNTEPLGAAIIAGVAAGIFTDVASAVTSMVTPRGQVAVKPS